MKRVSTRAEILLAEIEAENDRQRWLLRTYKAGDPRRRSTARKVEGVHNSRPSDRARGGEKWKPRPPALGVDLLTIGLFIAATWLAALGLLWMVIELLRWALRIFGWGN